MEKDYIYYNLDGIKEELARLGVIRSLNESHDARVNDEKYLKKVIADTYKHPDAQEELSCYIHNFNSEHDMVYANPYNGKFNEEHVKLFKNFFVNKSMMMDEASCITAVKQLRAAIIEAYYWVFNNNIKSSY